MEKFFQRLAAALAEGAADPRRGELPAGVKVSTMEFPADGVTAFLGEVMPLDYRLSFGALTRTAPDGAEENIPAAVIPGSVIPGGRLLTRIVTAGQFLAGENPPGALVLPDAVTPVTPAILRAVLDCGGAGVFSDFTADRGRKYDEIPRLKLGEGEGGSVTAADRPFIGFAVSPRTGDELRGLADRGQLKVTVRCDGERFAGRIRVTVWEFPGEGSGEVWLFADDTVNAPTLARNIAGMGAPPCRVRLIHCTSAAGFSAWLASSLGAVGDLRAAGRVTAEGMTVRIVPMGRGLPFFRREAVAELPPAASPWREYASEMVFAPGDPALPFSVHRRAGKAAEVLPEILSGMDGGKDVSALLDAAERRVGSRLADRDVRSLTASLNRMADEGALRVVRRPEIGGEEIVSAMRECGITEKDILLVHASTARCGYIRGGAETLIEAVRSAVDTALFTTFTRPYIFLGGVNKGWNYRPFDPGDPDAVWTGNVGATVLRRFPEALRSRHITHSWAGFGPHAAACLSSHGESDPPSGENSPLAKALALGGKVLYFGTGLSPSTFLHYLEYVCDMPFLEDAVCRVKDPDGTTRIVLVPKHLPGHRDFYRPDAENCKFFRAAAEEGLCIRSAPLGMASLRVIDLRQFDEIGRRLLTRDPRMLLCDDPDCLFCRRF